MNGSSSSSGEQSSKEGYNVQHQQISVRSPHAENETTILTLQPLEMIDLDDYYKLHSDARVWEHLPSGRHPNSERSQIGIAESIEDWKTTGLGYWSVKSSDGNFAGVGGARIMSKEGNSSNSHQVWNVYYRVSFEWWGCGIASKLALEAMQAARHVRSDLPIVAFLLEHNTASKHIAEKALKLKLRWRGPDAGNPDQTAIRIVYSDRPLDKETLMMVIS